MKKMVPGAVALIAIWCGCYAVSLVIENLSYSQPIALAPLIELTPDEADRIIEHSKIPVCRFSLTASGCWPLLTYRRTPPPWQAMRAVKST